MSAADILKKYFERLPPERRGEHAGPRVDLLLLTASDAAAACSAVRPQALFWDVSPAQRHLKQASQVIPLPRFAAPLQSGRWNLPGEIDVDTSSLILPPLCRRMVA